MGIKFLMGNFSVSRPSITYADISATVLRILEWKNNNLDLQQSSLALDLLMLIAHHSFHRMPLSCKSCNSSLNFSNVAIRKQLLRYVNEGWIQIDQSTVDRRVRFVTALPKLTVAMNEYALLISNAYGVTGKATKGV